MSAISKVTETISAPSLSTSERRALPIRGNFATFGQGSTTNISDAPKRMASQPSTERRMALISNLADLYGFVEGLSSLREAHSMSRELAACFTDAFEFAGSFPLGVPRPSVWTDGECEVTFEWIGERDHAVVTLEGVGLLGYAMMKNHRSRPGSCIECKASVFPTDLLEYLKDFR